MNNPIPFECQYTPQFAELLHDLKISLVISTYQAGKVIILSAVEQDKLIQLPRNFDLAMGMAIKNDKMAITTYNEVIVLKKSIELAHSYPQKKNVYDGIFIPQATYYTGNIRMHDLAFIENNKLVGVNTLFSCLSYIDDNYHFTPFWKPNFISQIAPQDRCHLNGIAIENDKIKYVSALGKTDKPHAWRENKIQGGIVMEYPSGKIIADNLGMPHSPRIYDNELYLLNSAQGELIKINPETGNYDVITELGGFARGMAKYGDYLFIGVSKLRHNSKEFSDLPIAETSYAGVIAVYLPYGNIVGNFKYTTSVDEIYDVKILENLIRPSILSHNSNIHRLALNTPEFSTWAINK